MWWSVEVHRLWHLGNVSSIKQNLTWSSVVSRRSPCVQWKDPECLMETWPKGKARGLGEMGQAAGQLLNASTHCWVFAEWLESARRWTRATVSRGVAREHIFEEVAFKQSPERLDSSLENESWKGHSWQWEPRVMEALWQNRTSGVWQTQGGGFISQGPWKKVLTAWLEQQKCIPSLF